MRLPDVIADLKPLDLAHDHVDVNINCLARVNQRARPTEQWWACGCGQLGGVARLNGGATPERICWRACALGGAPDTDASRWRRRRAHPGWPTTRARPTVI